MGHELGTFGRTKDPIPRLNLRAGTLKVKLGTLKMRSETQDQDPEVKPEVLAFSKGGI